MSTDEELDVIRRMHHPYVIGYRNPDTNSIGSVIGYSKLLSCKEPGRYVAARCGEVNEETAFALFTNVLEEGGGISIAAEETKLSKLGFRDRLRKIKGMTSRKKDFLPQLRQMLRAIS